MSVTMQTKRAQWLPGIGLIIGVCVAVPSPASAQNATQMQMMAEVHQLTELTQRLQQSVNALADAVKDLKDQVKNTSARIDAEATAVAAASATQKEMFDTLSARVSSLDNNVKENGMNTQRLSQEVAPIRQALSDLLDSVNKAQTLAASASTPAPPTPDTTNAAAASATGTPGVTVADSPGQMYQDAFGFFSRGEYQIARDQFADFIQKFPTSPDAPAAQYWIGVSLMNEADKSQDAAQKTAKYTDAVSAFTDAVTKYKDCGCEYEADSYFERGRAYRALHQETKARDDFKKIQDEYARTKSPAWENANSLATQALRGK